LGLSLAANVMLGSALDVMPGGEMECFQRSVRLLLYGPYFVHHPAR
jgi:hypothetical protein